MTKIIDYSNFFTKFCGNDRYVTPQMPNLRPRKLGGDGSIPDPVH